jgi:hypothetical protein
MTSNRTARTFTIDSLELLDERLVPSTLAMTPHVAPAVVASAPPATTVIAEKGGSALASVYQQYTQGTFSPTNSSQFVFSGTSIRLDVVTSIANESTVLAELQQQGVFGYTTMTVGHVAVIEGYVPIAHLPTVAAYPAVISMDPVVHYPTTIRHLA